MKVYIGAGGQRSVNKCTDGEGESCVCSSGLNSKFKELTNDHCCLFDCCLPDRYSDQTAGKKSFPQLSWPKEMTMRCGWRGLVYTSKNSQCKGSFLSDVMDFRIFWAHFSHVNKHSLTPTRTWNKQCVCVLSALIL